LVTALIGMSNLLASTAESDVLAMLDEEIANLSDAYRAAERLAR